VRYSEEELEDSAVFQNYGFLPELIGRFALIVPFEPLDEGVMREILERQVLPARRLELQLAGIELDVHDDVVTRLVERALARQTGARGLASALTRALEDAAFEAFSAKGAKRVAVTLDGDAIVAEVDRGVGWKRTTEPEE
jgi:ATP-dependent Clp protease ATP-binding subunit ClpX